MNARSLYALVLGLVCTTACNEEASSNPQRPTHSEVALPSYEGNERRTHEKARGRMALVAAQALRLNWSLLAPPGANAPKSAAAARAWLGNVAAALDPKVLTPGAELGFVAEGFEPIARLQVSLHVSVIDDESGARRVVHADQLDVEPGRSYLAGIIKPVPGGQWPRPCTRYAIELGSFAGLIARTTLTLAGCPRALESLRGKVLFHVGRQAPPLYDFQGTLAAYRTAASATTPLLAPLGKAAFFLGWKAAFAGPAGVPRVRVRLVELPGEVVREDRELPLDAAWDSFAGGWEVTDAPPVWPRAGGHYRLDVSRVGGDGARLATGELRFP